MGKDAKHKFYMRPMEHDDIPSVALWLEELEDLTLFDSQSSLPVNRDLVRRDWKKTVSGSMKRNCYWFAIESGDGELVGVAGIDAISNVNGDCVLPIILTRDVRQKGLGVRIAGMLIDMAFGELRLHRITTYYRADNIATQNLVKALGFQVEGRLRQARFAHGRYYDQIAVGLLASEWKQTRPTIAGELGGGVELRFGRIGSQTRAWPDSHNFAAE